MKKQTLLYLPLVSMSTICLIHADSWLVGVHNASPYKIEFSTTEAKQLKTIETIKNLDLLQPNEVRKFNKILIPWHTESMFKFAKKHVLNYYISAKVLSKEPTTYYLQERFEPNRNASNIFLGELQGSNGVFGTSYSLNKNYVLFFDIQGTPELFEEDSFALSKAQEKVAEEKECAGLSGLAHIDCLQKQNARKLKKIDEAYESIKGQASSMKK